MREKLIVGDYLKFIDEYNSVSEYQLMLDAATNELYLEGSSDNCYADILDLRDVNLKVGIHRSKYQRDKEFADFMLELGLS